MLHSIMQVETCEFWGPFANACSQFIYLGNLLVVRDW